MKNLVRMMLGSLSLLATMAVCTQAAHAYGLKYEGKGCAVYTEDSGDRPDASITRITGSGITPDSGVVLRNAAGAPASFFTGESSSYGDASGNTTWQFPFWIPQLAKGNNDGSVPTSRIETARLEMTDLFQGPVLASVEVNIGILAGSISVKGDPRRNHKKGSWKISGLGVGTYYAFYLKNGKVASKVKLGKSTGKCGYLSTKQFTQPKKTKGNYTLVVQNGSRLKLTANHLETTFHKDLYAKVALVGKYATK